MREDLEVMAIMVGMVVFTLAFYAILVSGVIAVSVWTLRALGVM